MANYRENDKTKYVEIRVRMAGNTRFTTKYARKLRFIKFVGPERLSPRYCHVSVNDRESSDL